MLKPTAGQGDNHLAQGFADLREGMRLILAPGLRGFVLMPLLINLLLFAALFACLYQWFGATMQGLMGWLPDWVWIGAIQWLFWAFYGVTLLLILAYGFVALASLLSAPFYGYLSQAVERRCHQQSTAFVAAPQDTSRPALFKTLLETLPTSLWRELQKLWYFLPRLLLLLILSLIPGVNLLAAVLWPVFNGWVMALQYVDYPADNAQMPFEQMKQQLRRYRWRALGFGLPVALASMVPLVNLLVMPAAVCGGTVFWVRTRGLQQHRPGLDAR